MAEIDHLSLDILWETMKLLEYLGVLTGELWEQSWHTQGRFPIFEQVESEELICEIFKRNSTVFDLKHFPNNIQPIVVIHIWTDFFEIFIKV